MESDLGPCWVNIRGWEIKLSSIKAVSPNIHNSAFNRYGLNIVIDGASVCIDFLQALQERNEAHAQLLQLIKEHAHG